MQKLWVYVGTSTGGSSKGIYRFPFDPSTGNAGEVRLAAESVNPSFVAIHPNGQRLFAVNAISEFQGERTGGVSAFALDRSNGALSLLNQQPSGGTGPCHLVVDAAGRYVLVANYSGGSAACLPLGADGRLGPPSCVIQHAGSSVHPRRQEGPHAHSIDLDAANRFAFVADLGLDQILIYRYDGARGALTPHTTPSVPLAPGAGPRHLAFHPSGWNTPIDVKTTSIGGPYPSSRFAYVINELNSTVTAWSYDAAGGTLTEIQTIATLPEGFEGENYPSEVQVHPSGRFLYGSNRGHDSIAIYTIDAASGRLRTTGHQPSGGKWPRNFAIDPSGAWMIVGNQNSDNILFFRIDAASGALTPTGQTLESPAPICFKMLPIPNQ